MTILRIFTLIILYLQSGLCLASESNLSSTLTQCLRNLEKEQLSLATEMSGYHREQEIAFRQMETLHSQLKDKDFVPLEFFPFLDSIRSYQMNLAHEDVTKSKLKSAENGIEFMQALLKDGIVTQSKLNKRLSELEAGSSAMDHKRSEYDDEIGYKVAQLLAKEKEDRSELEIQEILKLEREKASLVAKLETQSNHQSLLLDFLSDTAWSAADWYKRPASVVDSEDLDEEEAKYFVSDVNSLLFTLERPEQFCPHCVGVVTGTLDLPKRDLSTDFDRISSMELHFYEERLGGLERELGFLKIQHKQDLDRYEALLASLKAKKKIASLQSQYALKLLSNLIERQKNDIERDEKLIAGLHGTVEAYLRLRKDWVDSAEKLEDRLKLNRELDEGLSAKMQDIMGAATDLYNNEENQKFYKLEYYPKFKIVVRSDLTDSGLKKKQADFIERSLNPIREALSQTQRQRNQIGAENAVIPLMVTLLNKPFSVFDPHLLEQTPTLEQLRYQELKTAPKAKEVPSSRDSNELEDEDRAN